MRILARVPITFEGADAQTQHAPLVVGSFGARSTRLVLDTGSDVHLLTEDLADALGLDKVPGEEGVDHGGATMPSWSVGSAAMDLGAARLTLEGIVAIPAPPPFAGWGVGGIVAPQLLHPTAAAVIDLVGDELVLVEGSDDEVEAFLRDRNPDLTLLRLPRSTDASNLIVPAAIAGYREIPALVDTGGKETEIAASVVPDILTRDAGTLGRGVGGNAFAGAVAGPQTLVVAGRRLAVPDLAVRSTMHGPQCLIGMDVLRGTVLTAAADLIRPVFWQVRPAG